MDAEENQRQVSLRAHSPWKSLRDSHIPTGSTGRGKVENEKHVSHFPAGCFFYESKPIQKGGLAVGRFAPAFRLIFQ